MKMKAYIVQICLLLAITPAFSQFPGQPAPYNPSTAISQNTALTDANFDQILYENNDKPWFIKFYAPWCHHCQALAPTWTELAGQMTEVHFGEVDCVTSYGLCSRFEVQGFPTLIFAEGMKTLYTFPIMMRTSDTMRNFVKDTINYHNTSVSKPFPVNSQFVPTPSQNTTSESSSTIINSTTEISGNSSENVAEINNTTPLPPTSPAQPTETGISPAHAPSNLPAGKDNERISQDTTIAGNTPQLPEAIRSDLYNITNPDTIKTTQNPTGTIPNQDQNDPNALNAARANDYDLNTHQNFSNPTSNPNLFNSTAEQQQPNAPSTTGPYDPNAAKPIAPQHPSYDPRDPRNKQNLPENIPNSPTDQYRYAGSAGVPPTENANRPDYRNALNPNVPNQNFSLTHSNNSALPPNTPGFNTENTPAALNTTSTTHAAWNTTHNQALGNTNDNINTGLNNTPNAENYPQWYQQQLTGQATAKTSETPMNNTPAFQNNTAAINNTQNTTGVPQPASGLPNELTTIGNHSAVNRTQGINSSNDSTLNTTLNQSTQGINTTNASTLNTTLNQSAQGINASNASTLNTTLNQTTQGINASNDSTINTTEASADKNILEKAYDATIGSVVNSVESLFDSTVEKTTDAATEKVTGLANDTIDALAEKTSANVSGLTDAIKGTVSDVAGSAISDFAANGTNMNLTNTASNVIDSVSNATNTNLSNLTGTAGELYNKFSNANTSDIKNMATEAIDSISSGTGSNLTDAAGNIISNLTDSNITETGKNLLDSASSLAKTDLKDTAGNLIDQASNATGTNLSNAADTLLNGSNLSSTANQLRDTAGNLIDQASDVTGTNLSNAADALLNGSNLSSTATQIRDAAGNLIDQASNVTGTNVSNAADALLNGSNLSNTANQIYDAATTNLSHTAGNLLNDTAANLSGKTGDLLNTTDASISQTVGNVAGNLTEANATTGSILDKASSVVDKLKDTATSTAGNMMDMVFNSTVASPNMTAPNTTVTTETTPVDPNSGTPKVPVDTTNTKPTDAVSPTLSDSPVTGINASTNDSATIYTSQAGTVIKLTDKDFDDILAKYPGNNPWFIKFYAPWCPHCQRLAPTWVDLAKELKDEVNVADVDCVENYALRQRFSINGYPTLVMIVDDSMYLYRGERSVEALKEFALNTKQFKNMTVATAMPPKNSNFGVNWGVETGRFNWLILPVVILTGLTLTLGFIYLVYALIVKFATRRTVEPIQFAELNGESAEIGESPEQEDGKIGELEDEHSKINIDTTRDSEGILTDRANKQKMKDKYGGTYDIEKGDVIA